MSELKRCPFCGVSLKKIGSKRRGNQFYVHDYKGPDCILKEFSFKADDEEKMKHWNTRKPMQNIVERLEEENTLLKEQRSEAIEYDDEQIIFATNNQIRAFDYSLRVIKEEGGMNEN